MEIVKINPTIYIKKLEGKLLHCIRIEYICEQVENNIKVIVRSANDIDIHSENIEIINKGNDTLEIYIPLLEKKQNMSFIFLKDNIEIYNRVIEIKPPRKWKVHVVQLSHHDLGYTDIPSRVLKEHNKWVDMIPKFVEATKNYPDEAKFRVVIEQAWSIIDYLKNADKDKKDKMIELIKNGTVEVTALFGNMITELCEHEELIRTLYTSFSLKKEYGIEITSAEHNDITGFSWGLCRILTDAGIKMICPGLPLFYSWEKDKGEIRSFWNQEKVFGHNGPGAFWWESPTKKRILFWCNNSGCGGDHTSEMIDLEGKLDELNNPEYPHSIIRWPVQGAARDNSPYLVEYCETIKEWNEKWEWPKLVSSTDKIFYDDYIKTVPKDLPILRGELPGQDYSAGALSSAGTTGLNRRNSRDIKRAETVATLAKIAKVNKYPKETINEAYEEIRWYDEHTYGYHFPCGPGMLLSKAENEIRAYRGAAFAHEVNNKAMAAIADNIKTDDKSLYLVVFNSSSNKRTDIVHAMLREIDNIGSDIIKKTNEDASSYLKGAILGKRWHANPTLDIVKGNFELIDMETSEKIEYEINEITSNMEPSPYSAERLGLGSGTKRYGLFEEPLGIKRTIVFIAKDMPSFGYRTYKMVAKEIEKEKDNVLYINDEKFIENEYYHIKWDSEKKRIIGIYDKEAKRELIDNSNSYAFGEMLVIDKRTGEKHSLRIDNIEILKNNDIEKTVSLVGGIYGHPAIRMDISLYNDIKRIYVAYKILKDSTPMLETNIAFPFAFKNPSFYYQGALANIDPKKDFLPEAIQNFIAVQDWVCVKDNKYNIIWNSFDAPTVSLGELNPTYVSPAHSCIFDKEANGNGVIDFNPKNGHIYSAIFNNNFGTNFYTTQTGDYVFKYSITTCTGDITENEISRLSEETLMPFEQIITKGNISGELPKTNSFIEISNSNVRVLALKMSEEGDSYVLRFWNMTKEEQELSIKIKDSNICRAVRLNNVEEEQEILKIADKQVLISIKEDDIYTIKIYLS